jgi:cytochrome d ubiquinol oxidase subunit I
MKGLRVGVGRGALLIPVQIVVGDVHGLNTLEHQPAKVAAIEANWETRPAVPLVLFALPDEEARENRFEIGIPYGASLILKHDPQGVVPGLNDFEGKHPPVSPVFWSFRVMVGVGCSCSRCRGWRPGSSGGGRSPRGSWAMPSWG